MDETPKLERNEFKTDRNPLRRTTYVRTYVFPVIRSDGNVRESRKSIFQNELDHWMVELYTLWYNWICLYDTNKHETE